MEAGVLGFTRERAHPPALRRSRARAGLADRKRGGAPRPEHLGTARTSLDGFDDLAEIDAGVPYQGRLPHARQLGSLRVRQGSDLLRRPAKRLVRPLPQAALPVGADHALRGEFVSTLSRLYQDD